MSLIFPLIENYVTELSSQEPSYLKNIREKMIQDKEFPLFMLSGVYQGRFLSLISKIQRPKKILEIGTFIGYSALCLAEGFENHQGKLITLESNQKWRQMAETNFVNSPYKDNIKLIYGEALNSLQNLNEKFDLAFIDADKQNYSNYFDLILPKMQKGGLILSDNILWRGEVAKVNTIDRKAKLFREYNEKLKKDPRIQTLVIPIRDGLSISRVL